MAGTYKTFPKHPLGFFPTPVTGLPNLSRTLGCAELFIKRDDMTGLAFGGNKTRKLEYLLGDAVNSGCDTIITAGAAQSNHCRQTAAAAAYMNMECHLLLGGEKPDRTTGNLLIDTLMGSHIHWAGKHRKGEDIPELFKALTASGKRPYIVPYGGSNELGALSFIDAVEELDHQTGTVPFSHIVFASSSGGTQAGLMVGKELFKKKYALIGINIDKDETGQVPFDQYIINLANSTGKVVGLNYHFSAQDLILNTDYVGDGYGVVGELENEAIRLTARHEGILLDPVYTGRAMGGLIDMIRKGAIAKESKVLFWHTGGTPALFAHANELIL